MFECYRDFWGDGRLFLIIYLNEVLCIGVKKKNASLCEEKIAGDLFNRSKLLYAGIRTQNPVYIYESKSFTISFQMVKLLITIKHKK